MSRTTVVTALVLRCRPSNLFSASQEANSEVTLLTAEEGIIKATVFGGPKSKLRSHTAPYNSGQVWIYRDPAKDYRKLSDFDVQSWRPGLRELYERTIAAGGIAQTILGSHGGGGDWDTALKLAATALDALENANEELCSFLLIHFLWRWAEFLGIQPQIGFCAACGLESADAPFWFCTIENNVLCSNCLSSESARANSIKINSGCRKWLLLTGQIEPSFLYRFSMDNKSLSETKILVTAVMTETFGKRLPLWDI